MKIVGGPYCGGYIGIELQSYPILTVTLLRQLYEPAPYSGDWRWKEYNWEKL